MGLKVIVFYRERPSLREVKDAERAKIPRVREGAITINNSRNARSKGVNTSEVKMESYDYDNRYNIIIREEKNKGGVKGERSSP